MEKMAKSETPLVKYKRLHAESQAQQTGAWENLPQTQQEESRRLFTQAEEIYAEFKRGILNMVLTDRAEHILFELVDGDASKATPEFMNLAKIVLRKKPREIGRKANS